MRDHPILFSAPMVRAILADRKTHTRRIVKPQPDDVSCGMALQFVTHKFLEDGKAVERDRDVEGNRFVKILTCPYGQPGDRLWVRESFATLAPGSFEEEPPRKFSGQEVRYAANREDAALAKCNDQRWRPSIHMPRWASRILLEITSTRVERLQEITEVDAIAEGALSVRSDAWDRKHFPTYASERDHAYATGTKPPLGPSPRRTFQALWESINGEESWPANPWVWVVEFRRVEVSA